MTMIKGVKHGILEMSGNQCTAPIMQCAEGARHNGILESYKADSGEPLQ
jgi:hypothetical protein